MANITYVPPRNNKAKNIKIDDIDNNFQSNDVEGALNEVCQKVKNQVKVEYDESTGNLQIG